MKHTLLLLLLALLLLPGAVGLSYFETRCFPLANATPCLNTSTGITIIQYAKINWSDILNPQTGNTSWNHSGYWSNATGSFYPLNSNPLAYSNITCTGGNTSHANVTNGTNSCIMVARDPGGSGAADGNNYTISIDITGTTTKTVNLVRSGAPNINATFIDLDTDTDTNNYTVTCSVTGTTTKTATCSRNGWDNYTYSWSDLDTDTDTDTSYNATYAGYGTVIGDLQLANVTLNNKVITLGNWTSDRAAYINETRYLVLNATLCQSDGTNCPANTGNTSWNHSGYWSNATGSFYPLNSNPTAYITDGNTGWDNSYLFIANATRATLTDLFISTLTTGSVVFVGVNANLSQDNTQFFYNITAHRLCLGMGANCIGKNNTQLAVNMDVNVSNGSVYVNNDVVLGNGSGNYGQVYARGTDLIVNASGIVNITSETAMNGVSNDGSGAILCIKADKTIGTCTVAVVGVLCTCA